MIRAFIDSPYGNRKEAIQYLRIGATRFDTLRASGVIKALGRDWFFKDDLDEVGKLIAIKRDKCNTINIHESKPEKGRTLGDQDHPAWSDEAKKFI